MPLGFPFRVFRVAHAWTPPRSKAARAIAVNSRRFKKSILLAGAQLRWEHAPDEGDVRESSRLSCSARATAVDVAFHRNALPVGLARPLGVHLEERRVLPATDWAAVRSERFGGRGDGLLPLLFRNSGRHRVVRAPEEA